MNFTVENLEKMPFDKALNGYNISQVKEALSKIAEDYRKSATEIEELKCRVSVLSETVQHYKTIEESMQHCLIIAQHTCDDMKTIAADHAKSIIYDAETTAQKMMNEATVEVNNLRLSYDEIKGRIFNFRNKTEALLTAQLDVLKQLSDG